MANSLEEVTPVLIAQGLMALRENAIMPRIVNMDYQDEAREKGDVVNIPIPSAVAATDVAPGLVPTAGTDVIPTKATVELNQWKEAKFQMTDTDIQKALDGIMPMQASEAVKSLGNAIDNYVHSLYTGIYSVSGVAGNTPFSSDLTEGTWARKNLNNNLAPLDNRRYVLDPDAEANFLNVATIINANQRGDTDGVREASMGRKIGFDFYMSQNVTTHVSTPFTAGAVTVNGANVAGSDTISLNKITNPTDLVKGDILTFAGDDQTYTVTADVTLIIGNTTVGISPSLQVTTTGGEAVTLTASHVVNLAMHRDAFALATRPLLDIGGGLGNIIQSATDPVTGLTLRLEISRQHKQTQFAYDILWGATLVRPELADRSMG